MILHSSIAAAFTLAAATGFAGEASDPGLVLAQLHVINAAEVEAGQLAQGKGVREAVKAFGRLLETEHEKADADVVALSSKLHVDFGAFAEAPEVEARQAEAEKVKAKLLNSEDFDAVFAEEMVVGHDVAIALVREELTASTHGELKVLLKNLLPKLRLHRQKAAALKADR